MSAGSNPATDTQHATKAGRQRNFAAEKRRFFGASERKEAMKTVAEGSMQRLWQARLAVLAIENGASLREAACGLGIDHKTLLTRIGRYPDLKDRYEAHRATRREAA
jgi:hypothetical protein